jgi:hypothetical protein
MAAAVMAAPRISSMQRDEIIASEAFEKLKRDANGAARLLSFATAKRVHDSLDQWPQHRIRAKRCHVQHSRLLAMPFRR